MVIVQVFILKFVENNFNKTLDEEKNNIKIEKESISQEIILPEKDLEKSLKTPKAMKFSKNNSKIDSIVVNENIKQIRINNTMATANINYKKDLSIVWKKLNDYFMDDKYGKIAQLLADTVPMVVGTNNMILTTNSAGLANNIYASIDLAEDFIKKIYQLMKIVIISEDEFESVKEKYISDKKNDIIYQIQEESDKLVNVNSNLINQALDVFGSDLVEIE